MVRQAKLGRTNRMVMKEKVMQGKPYAGNPHVRFDEGAGAPRHSGRSALLYKNRLMVVGVALSCAAFGIMKENQGFRAPKSDAKEAVRGFLWLEAESFADYGEWRLDTQFTHKMGSAYLLAAGVLKPIKPATTSVNFPKAGKWRAWVRTKDWLPEYHPGKFRLSVAGKPGNTLGASGKEGWRWELAGEWTLPAGEAKVALEDLTGAFARCDALLFTQDAAYVPPDDAAACAAARGRFTGADAETVADAGSYDLVVVGGGPGGLGAAIAAARHGAKVALVHDRPVLGGNSSSEIGVPPEGAAVSHHVASREGGIIQEANLRRMVAPDCSLSYAYREMVDALPNLAVFDNQRVVAVGMDGGRVASVEARNTLDGKRSRWQGRLFVDCTGDGWVGVFAGAKRMYGREAAAEYGEAQAPEERDNLTMSGCLACATAEVVRYGHMYIGYMQRRTGDEPVPYETPEWAKVLPPDFNRRVKHPHGEWWLEHGGRFDDVEDPERARDELVRINFAYWGWLKNEWQKKDEIKCNELVEISHMNGRREGYRLVGDYILTANDCLQGRMFDDRVAYGGWPLDTHDPLGIDNPRGNGFWKHHPTVPIYSIPFRCLYSVNVPNLMMAGRNISVTHIALGSTRVMSTIATLGQAVGTAAAEMLDTGLMPREYGADHVRIRRLQQLLLKDDQYIPQVVNEDDADLARTAKATATSTYASAATTTGNMKPPSRGAQGHELNMPRATGYTHEAARGAKFFECLLESSADKPVQVTARVYAAQVPTQKGNVPEAELNFTLLGETAATVAPGGRRWTRFEFPAAIPGESPFVWVQLQSNPNVMWYLAESSCDSHRCRAWCRKAWNFVPGESYALVPEGGIKPASDDVPEPGRVIDGISRNVGGKAHGWVSDPKQCFPQTLTLEFPKPVSAHEVRITFDPDLDTRHTRGKPLPRTLVKKYAVEAFDGKGWTPLASETDNVLRHCIHDFPGRTMNAVRIRVDETWGDPSARIFEVRVY